MRLLLINEHFSYERNILHDLAHSYVVDSQKNLEQGLYQVYLYQYDLIVVCAPANEQSLVQRVQKLRQDKITSPIICIISTHEQSFRNRLYQSGVNDLLFLPLSLDELKIKIQHHIQLKQNQLANKPKKLLNLKLKLDEDKQLISYREHAINLRRKEMMLMECFIKNPRQVLTRQQIKERVWLDDLSVSDNNFTVILCNLRKKLQKQFNLNPIKTIHGFGYKLTENLY